MTQYYLIDENLLEETVKGMMECGYPDSAQVLKKSVLLIPECTSKKHCKFMIFPKGINPNDFVGCAHSPTCVQEL